MAMSEATKQKIAGYKSDPAITEIDLHDEELGDEGLNLLVDALKDRQLQKLNLKNCQVSHSSENWIALVKIIKASPNLTCLELDWHNMTNLISSMNREVMADWETKLNSEIAVNKTTIDEQVKKIAELENKINTEMVIKQVFAQLQVTADQKIAALETSKAEQQEKIVELERMFSTEMAAKQQLIESLQRSTENLTKLDPLIKEVEEAQDKIETLETRISENETEMSTLSDMLNKEFRTTLDDLKKMANETVAELENKIAGCDAQVKEKLKAEKRFNDLLFRASKTGNYNLASIALQIGASLDAIDPETGETSLTIALQRGYKEIAEMFIEKDPKSLTYINTTDMTPLEKAVQEEQDELTKQIVTWLWGKTKPLLNEEEKRETLKKLYDKSRKPSKIILATDLLWEAVKMGGDNALVKLQETLLHNQSDELELDINKLLHPEDNETLLYELVFYRQDISLINFLLLNGADIDVKSHVEMIPLDASAEQIDSLKKREESAYELACVMYKDLWSKDADEGKREKGIKLMVLFGTQALAKSIREDNLEALDNALIKAKDILKESYAMILGEKVILSEFHTLEYRLSGTPDYNEQTVLHFAAQSANPVFMEKLLNVLPEGDPLLEIKNSNGKTALHLAVENQNEKIVELLLRKGASVDAKDNSGQVPLHKAVAAYDKSSDTSMTIITNLVKKHADCNSEVYVEDAIGEAPMTIAIRNGNAKLGNDLAVMFGAFSRETDKISNTSCTSSLSSSGMFSNSLLMQKEPQNLKKSKRTNSQPIIKIHCELDSLSTRRPS